MSRESSLVLDEDVLTVLRLISRMDLVLGVSVAHSFGRPVHDHIASLRAEGYISDQVSRRLDGTSALLYTVTNTGKAALAAKAKESADLTTAASKSPLHRETYSGAELRPFTGRAGSMDALRIPSRVGNRLRFRTDDIAKGDQSTRTPNDGKDNGRQS